MLSVTLNELILASADCFDASDLYPMMNDVFSLSIGCSFYECKIWSRVPWPCSLHLITSRTEVPDTVMAVFCLVIGLSFM